MRILLPTIRDRGQIGGGGTHLVLLVNGLREIGHEAEALYVADAMPRLVRRAGLVWPAGVLNRARKGWGMVYAADLRARLLAGSTARQLRTAPFDILNAQEVYSVPFLREQADAAGIPLVLTLHGYPLYESRSEGYSAKSEFGLAYLMRAEIQALRLADAVITVDHRLLEHARRLVPERAGSMHTLMNFVDITAFAPAPTSSDEAATRAALRRKWRIPPEVTVLLCPRRLVKKNGVTLPALGLATMPEAERAGYVLLYAGEGGERAAIDDILRDNGLEKNVRLLGGQDHAAMLELYRLCDIVLVPSVHSKNVEEATSLSALEAMASGRPLVAGNVGGLAEMVEDERNGLLISADPVALAAAVRHLTANPDLAASLAAAAREYVVREHSHVRAAQAYASIYEAATYRQRRKGGRAALGFAGAAVGSLQLEELVLPQPAGRSDQSVQPSVSVLGFNLDLLSLDDAAQWVCRQARRADETLRRTALVFSFNPELILRAQRDSRVTEAILHADLCLPDGVGVVWAANRQGVRPAQGAGGDQSNL